MPTKWLAVIAAILVGVGAYFLFHQDGMDENDTNDEKEEIVNQDVNLHHSQMVEDCCGLIRNGSNASPLPFIEAKDKLKDLELYEDRYRNQLDSMAADSIGGVLDSLMKEAAHQWAEAARSQAEANQELTAIDFYQLSLRLYEDQEVRQTYEQLKEKVFKQ